jgi:hypothetical protein
VTQKKVSGFQMPCGSGTMRAAADQNAHLRDQPCRSAIQRAQGKWRLCAPRVYLAHSIECPLRQKIVIVAAIRSERGAR